MPSRARNRIPPMEQRITAFLQLYWYRFGIFFQQHENPAAIARGGAVWTALKYGASIAALTDESKKQMGYVDIRPWPAADEEINERVDNYIQRYPLITRKYFLL